VFQFLKEAKLGKLLRHSGPAVWKMYQVVPARVPHQSPAKPIEILTQHLLSIRAEPHPAAMPALLGKLALTELSHWA
jgi:hypothetical protein